MSLAKSCRRPQTSITNCLFLSSPKQEGCLCVREYSPFALLFSVCVCVCVFLAIEITIAVGLVEQVIPTVDQEDSVLENKLPFVLGP